MTEVKKYAYITRCELEVGAEVFENHDKLSKMDRNRVQLSPKPAAMWSQVLSTAL